MDDLSLVFMTSRVRVQRVLMSSGVESATVVRDGEVVGCVDRFLAHLTAIEKSPNTVRAYAHGAPETTPALNSPSCSPSPAPRPTAQCNVPANRDQRRRQAGRDDERLRRRRREQTPQGLLITSVVVPADLEPTRKVLRGLVHGGRGPDLLRY